MTIWTLIQTSISESCTAFIEAAPYLRQEALAEGLVHHARASAQSRGFCAQHHHHPARLSHLSLRAEPRGVIGDPGLFLVLMGVFAAAGCLAIFCTRFRDMPQIVGNLLQLAFFVTPVMWHVEQLGQNAFYVEVFNPFAAFLRIVAEPLLGHVPTLQTYVSVIIYLGIMLADRLAAVREVSCPHRVLALNEVS